MAATAQSDKNRIAMKKTALMQLESEINEVVEDLEYQIKQSDDSDWAGLLTARMKIYESVNTRINQLILTTEREQIEAAAMDRSGRSAQQYYTETYGGGQG